MFSSEEESWAAAVEVGVGEVVVGASGTCWYKWSGASALPDAG